VTTTEVNQLRDQEQTTRRKTDSEFAIKEITIPTNTEAHNAQAVPTPSGLTNPEPAVGSHHEQVLASWRSIFDRPTKPSRNEETETTPEAGAEPNKSRRFRQEQLNSMDLDTNQPYGDVSRPKSEGFSRFYYINPNGSEPPPRPTGFLRNSSEP
jgi:hypothetical protein